MECGLRETGSSSASADSTLWNQTFGRTRAKNRAVTNTRVYVRVQVISLPISFLINIYWNAFGDQISTSDEPRSDLKENSERRTCRDMSAVSVSRCQHDHAFECNDRMRGNQNFPSN